MARNKFLLAGIILAILAGIAIAVLLATAMPTTQVVKVSSEIHPGDILKDHIYLEEIPKRAVPQGAFFSLEGLDKMYSIATLYKGDILRKPHVSETITEGGTLSARLRGMNMSSRVGIALDTDATTGLKLEIGDSLQICAVSQYYTNPSNPTVVGQDISQPSIIIPEAPVIYVPSEEEEEGCVVVALTQEEFLKLSQAKEIGKLYAAVLPIGK